MMSLFKSLGKWLEDPAVLDANIHISSLAPIYMPKKLGDIIAGGESESRNVWWEYLLPYEVEAGTEGSVAEWDRMHFRGDLEIDHGRRTTPELAEVTPHEKIAKRLRSYDRPRPPPALSLTSPPVEQLSDSTFASAANLLAVAGPMIEALGEHAAQFNVETLEYGYLSCTYLELVPGLYQNVKREAAKRVNCAGTLGPKKEKLACSGVATIVLEFEEAARQEQVAVRVQQCEDGLGGLTRRMQSPASPSRLAASVTVLESMIGRILMSYSRYTPMTSHLQPSPERALYEELGASLFYALAEILRSEEVAGCPALRHFLSSAMEDLGGSVIAGKPDRYGHLVN